MTYKRFLRSVLRHRLFAAGVWRVAASVDAVASQASRLARKMKRNGGTVVYDGIPLRFPPNVGVDFLSSIYWRGREGYEPNVWRVLRQLLPRSRSFVDIGAHIGFYTVLAQRLCPDLSFLAFEPVPELFAAAREFLIANGVGVGGLHQLALGDRDGEAKLFLPVDYLTMGSLAAPLAGHKCREVPVALKRLDTFLEKQSLRGPVTIKLDVEDYEYAVLKGAEQTIARYRPYIVCELLPRAHHNAGAIGLIYELGYAPFAITRDGCFRMSREDFTRERPFRDFILIPAERVAPSRLFVPFDELGVESEISPKKSIPGKGGA